MHKTCRDRVSRAYPVPSKNYFDDDIQQDTSNAENRCRGVTKNSAEISKSNRDVKKRRKRHAIPTCLPRKYDRMCLEPALAKADHFNIKRMRTNASITREINKMNGASPTSGVALGEFRLRRKIIARLLPWRVWRVSTQEIRRKGNTRMDRLSRGPESSSLRHYATIEARLSLLRPEASNRSVRNKGEIGSDHRYSHGYAVHLLSSSFWGR